MKHSRNEKYPYEKIPDKEQTLVINMHGTLPSQIPHDAAPSSPNSYAMTLIFLCVFVGDMARGILFPTLWLFVQQMGGNKMHQGMVVASFSLGRILSSPLLGTFSEVYGYIPVLVLSNGIIALGCLGYATANNLPALVLAQVVIGFGSGTLGVTRSYIAENYSRKNRSEHMAYLTAVQYAGFTVTPIFGSIVSYLGYHYPITTKLMYIDEFSVPALFMGGFAALLAAAFASFDVVTTAHSGRKVDFSVPRRTEIVEKTECQDENNKLLVQEDKSSAYATPGSDISYQLGGEVSAEDREDEYSDAITTRNALIIGGCAMNIFTKGTIGVFETLGSEYATGLIDLSSSSTGYVFSALGACGAVTLVCFSHLVKMYDEVKLTISGIYLMILSCVIMSIIPLIVTYDSEQHAMYAASHMVMFMIAVCSMYATGYPVGHTAVLCLFSKIQKNGPQGALLGWFGFSGSLARIFFPLSAGVIAQFSIGGDSVVFLSLGCILCVSLCLMINYQNLIRVQCDL